MELSVDNKGGLSKKKLIESVTAVPFRQITPLEFKKQNISSGPIPQTEAKLVIETESKNIIAETIPLYKKSDNNHNQPAPADPESQVKNNKLTDLDNIRKQFRKKVSDSTGDTYQPIDLAQLTECWNGYIQHLKNEKNSAAQIFENVSLRLIDDNSFEIIASDNLQQKFIESERNRLFDYLQKKLRTRLLKFTVLIEEIPGNKTKAEIPLSSREQFQKLIEEYPLLKELKDRLKLELDY